MQQSTRGAEGRQGMTVWWPRARSTLQLGLTTGGVTAVVFGLVTALLAPSGLGAGGALVVTYPAFVAAVVHATRWGMDEPAVRFTPTLTRLVATAALGAGSALLAAAAVTAALGAVLTPQGGLALAALGVVAAVLGRLRGRDGGDGDDAPLVSTREWAAADDATAVGALLLLTVAATVTADPVRQALAIAGALGPLGPGGRIGLIALGIGVPLTTLAMLARTPPGRSPVARGLLMTTLAPLGGMVLMKLLAPVATPSAAVEPSIAAAAAAWRRGQAIGGCAALAGAISAALVALTAALRARAHGVVVDDHGRRTSTLLAALTSGAVVLLTAALVLGKAGFTALPALGVATSLTGVVAVIAVHLGAGSLGANPSPMRQRAGGYVASATIAGGLAVVEASAAVALFASLTRADPATPFSWPSALPAAAVEQHVQGGLALSSLVPLVVAAGLTLRGRGGLRCFAIAGRHLNWAVLSASLAIFGIAWQVPKLRAAVAAPLDALVGLVETPAVAASGPLCRRLDAEQLLRLKDEGLVLGSATLATASFDDADALDGALAPLRAGAVTLAVDAEAPAASLAPVLGALARAGRCELRLLAFDRDRALPRCASGRIAGAGCPSAPPAEVMRLGPGTLQVDRGAPGGGLPGVARLRSGVFPDDGFLWQELGRGDVGLSVAGDTRAQDVVWMWHELRRVARKGELRYLLPAPPAKPATIEDAPEVELALTAADPATAIALEPHFSRRRGRLAACLSREPASVFRVALRDDGRLAAVIPAEGASWSGAGCVFAQLGDLVVPLPRATMVVLSLYRR